MDFKEAIKKYAMAYKVSEKEAREDAERLIASWMKNDGYTREFAEATFIEDQEDLDIAELDRMEQQAKENGATKVKARRASNYSLEGQKKRERKPNEEKREIINFLAYSLGECDKFGENFAETVETTNIEREITFKIGENAYSLTLTCHRKPKK